MTSVVTCFTCDTDYCDVATDGTMILWCIRSQTKQGGDHNNVVVGEARAIRDVGHYGKSLYLQNSESSNCMSMVSGTNHSSLDRHFFFRTMIKTIKHIGHKTSISVGRLDAAQNVQLSRRET